MAMKRTLLEMTKDILVSLDGDEVSSITDSAESASIANIIRQAFYTIVSRTKLPEHGGVFKLTETSSSTPVVMTKPNNVIDVHWVKYDTREEDDTAPSMTKMMYIPFSTFMEMQDNLDGEADNVSTFNYSVDSVNHVIKFINDQDPQYYTAVDDNTIFFDAVNLDLETFLRSSKSQGFGIKESIWTHEDSFVPPLDHRLSNLLFQEAKAQCFVELKQVENARAERAVKRAWVNMQKNKYNFEEHGKGYYYDTNYLPNYGRK